jgi:hypothetical protein
MLTPRSTRATSPRHLFGEELFLLVLLLLFFLQISSSRLVAGDEGFYTLATKLVSQGRVPYKDFFYPQMPLLPYLFYGWASATSGTLSWQGLRGLSAVCATLICLLVYLRVRASASSGSRFWANLACIVLATCPLFFPWILTVESYASATLLVLLATLLSENFLWAASARTLFMAGICLGLAVDIRLYLLALLPALILGVERRYLGSLLGGFWLATLPAQLMLLAHWDAFWFNNVGYHLQRSQASVNDMLAGKWMIATILVGLKHTRKFEGILPYVLVNVGMFCAMVHLGKHRLVAMATITIAAVSFIPTPAYVQYFCILTPFLALHLFLALSEANITSSLHVKLLIGGLFGFLCTLGLAQNISAYTFTGKGVLGMHGDNPHLTYSPTVTSIVSRTINSHFEEHAVVFSSWSGYLLETHVQPLGGTENRFGMRIGKDLTPEHQKAVRISTLRDVNRSIRRGDIDGAVLRDYYASAHPALVRALDRSGYDLVYRGNGVQIWKLN